MLPNEILLMVAEQGITDPRLDKKTRGAVAWTWYKTSKLFTPVARSHLFKKAVIEAGETALMGEDVDFFSQAYVACHIRTLCFRVLGEADKAQKNRLRRYQEKKAAAEQEAGPRDDSDSDNMSVYSDEYDMEGSESEGDRREQTAYKATEVSLGVFRLMRKCLLMEKLTIQSFDELSTDRMFALSSAIASILSTIRFTKLKSMRADTSFLRELKSLWAPKVLNTLMKENLSRVTTFKLGDAVYSRDRSILPMHHRFHFRMLEKWLVKLPLRSLCLMKLESKYDTRLTLRVRLLRSLVHLVHFDLSDAQVDQLSLLFKDLKLLQSIQLSNCRLSISDDRWSNVFEVMIELPLTSISLSSLYYMDGIHEAHERCRRTICPETKQDVIAFDNLREYLASRGLSSAFVNWSTCKALA